MSPSSHGSTGADATVPSTTATAPAVELRNITKTFGAVTACDNVDLALKSGQIHGILGENGAGKSTLMKILIGLVLPDSGSTVIAGVDHKIQSPQQAAALGIGMVHQHFSLVDALSVWENVALGDPGRLDPQAIRDRIGLIGEQYGLAIDPDANVGSLTAGLRQRVEIIKCLRRDPGIVIFDEPTSVLTPDESQQLFESFRDVVAAQGKAVVLVSHKLDEVLAATDEITIMRQGAVVDRVPTSEATAAGLARSMVGRDVALRPTQAALGHLDVAAIEADSDPQPATYSVDDSPASASTTPALELRGVTVLGGRGPRLLDGLDLQLHPGEILGLAGVEGNGQRVLGDLLSSLVKIDAGEVLVNGSVVATHQAGAMSRAGIGVIPEDRHDSGVVLDMTVAENLALSDLERFSTRGVLDASRLEAHALAIIDEFEIQCAGPHAPLWSLSGGNQQRVVLARELSAEPSVLVAAQPTRGLDVGAIEYMNGRLRAAAVDGVAVLLISSELEEILDLADRIAVIYAGQIAGSMLRAQVDLEHLGLLMGGATT